MENCGFFFLYIGSILASFILCRIEFRPNDGTYLRDGWFDFCPWYGIGFNKVAAWTQHETMLDKIKVRKNKITYYGTRANYKWSHQIISAQLNQKTLSSNPFITETWKSKKLWSFYQLIYEVKSFSELEILYFKYLVIKGRFFIGIFFR